MNRIKGGKPKGHRNMPSCAIRRRIAIRELWIREFIFWLWRIAIFIISTLKLISRQFRWNPDKIESITPQLHCKHHKWLYLLLIDSILLIRTKFMCWDFKFTVKNQNLPKCRIVAEFFHETPIRAFFRGFQTNCTTRVQEYWCLSSEE